MWHFPNPFANHTLAGRLSRAEANITNLQKQQMATSDELAQIQKDLDTIKTGIAGLQAQIAGFNPELSAADQATLDAIKASADSLAGQFLVTPPPAPPAA